MLKIGLNRFYIVINYRFIINDIGKNKNVIWKIYKLINYYYCFLYIECYDFFLVKFVFKYVNYEKYLCIYRYKYYIIIL